VVSQWLVNNGIVQTGGTSYTVNNVTAATSVQVMFTAAPTTTYTVTPSAGANGTINPNTAQTVNSGGSVTFTATPASGYVVSQWLANNSVAQTGGTSYTLNNVTAATSVQVTFTTAPTTTYTVTPSAGANGTINPNTVQTVSSGGSVTFTATPASGYVVSQWLVNATATQNGGPTFTLNNVSAATSVQVTFTATAPRTNSSPQITHVLFSGSAGSYTITVNGSGLGNLPGLPIVNNTTTNLSIVDFPELGHGAEWGYSGDYNTLTYQSWSDTEIQLSGFGGQPGDAITIAIWNPITGAGAAWGGNVPESSGTPPQITSVTFTGSGTNLQIDILGSGFGNAPTNVPFVGDLNQLMFQDHSTHSGTGSFEAGGSRWGNGSPDSVTLIYQSWSDNEIVINGFAGSYGLGNNVLQNGDPVTIVLWNTSDTGQTGLQTAWGGFVTEQPLVSIGSLQVTINPVEAATAGAQWQVDGGTLQNSGATVTNLSVGNHTVNFTTISGWTTPSDQTVSVSANSTATTTGTYVNVLNYTITLSASPSTGGSVNGGGTFALGSSQTVTATANSGYRFIGWTGDASGTNNPLTVTLDTNLDITANFATTSTNFTLTVITNGHGTVSPNLNGFLPVKGTYNGLFFTTNGVTEQTAGMLKGLAINQKGRYTGTLLINGGSHAISGSFGLAGQATNHISRPAGQGGPLTVEMTLLSLSNSAPQVAGTVSGITNGVPWEADLTADLATNTLPSAEYTGLILSDTNNAPPNLSPGGYGYFLVTNYAGTARNPSAATARITGALADGTTFNQTVPVSQDGYVPIYANLYGAKGLLIGWFNLDLTNTAGVGLTWIHPARTTGLYQNGFTNILFPNQILLSPWTNPPANIDLLTNLSILDTINDTNALMDFTVTISNDFKFGEVSGPMPLSGCINPKTGLLKVTIGSGANKTNGYGAILLNATNGGGYFLTKTNAQVIQLGP
jgi:uncharacterized repeat protein (TIGR02543 family)